MRHTLGLVMAVMVLAAGLPRASQAPAPDIDALLNLQRVGSPSIAPDGRRVAYTLRETNWEANEYETEIWVGDGSAPRRLTTGAKSSLQPAWSPDGAWIAFVSDRDGKRQVYRIATDGGEAERLTRADEGVNAFAWSPDGRRIAYTMTDAVSAQVKEREQQFGELRIEDEDRRMAHLYRPRGAGTRRLRRAGRPAAHARVARRRQLRLVAGRRAIAFDHRTSSDPADGASADISVIALETGAAGDGRVAGGPRLEPALVAGRRPHRLRVVDGEAVLLLPEQRHRRGDAGPAARSTP